MNFIPPKFPTLPFSRTLTTARPVARNSWAAIANRCAEVWCWTFLAMVAACFAGGGRGVSATDKLFSYAMVGLFWAVVTLAPIGLLISLAAVIRLLLGVDRSRTYERALYVLAFNLVCTIVAGVLAFFIYALYHMH